MSNLLAEKKNKTEKEEVVMEKVSTAAKPVDRNSIEYKRKRDKELVKGIFHNYEVPGGSLEFTYKKYKGEQVEWFKMVDGEMYTIPLGVAKHLNNDVKYKVHQFKLDETGKKSKMIGKTIKRCSFESLDFITEDTGLDLNKEIITVENI